MNKRALLIVVLLLAFITGWYIACQKRVAPQVVIPAFDLQGQTVLAAGKIEMNIWDNDAEDGDTIAIYFKNNLIADSLAILNTPVSLTIGNLQKGEYLLGVEAISEGLSSPATATISLTNGTEEKEFVMNATKEAAASWKIIIQ